MEVNYRLKGIIMDVVEKQIENNNPKATKETFNRLVEKGYDETTAKEMIAAVVVEDLYYMLKNKQVFDEKKFTKRLSKLE